MSGSGWTWLGKVGIATSVFWSIAALAAPHTVDELFRRSVVRDAALSPGGVRVAIVSRPEDKAADVLYVVDTQKLGTPNATRKVSFGSSERIETNWVRWVTDNRLLVGMRITLHSVTSARVLAMDADGGHQTILFANSKRILSHSLDLSQIVGSVPGDPTHVMMAAWSDWTYDLFDVNVMTGEARSVARGRESTLAWQVRDGKPVLRYDLNSTGTAISVYGNSGRAEDDWSLLIKYHREELRLPEWQFAGAGPGVGEIYIRTRYRDADTAGIYSYDIAQKTTGALIAEVPGYDMTSAVEVDGHYVGAAYVRDTIAYVLKDPVLQKHIDGLDKYFHHHANVNIEGIDRERKHVLLRIDGPQDPGDYYFYDVAQGHLELLMSARPWLEPERLASTEVRKFTMRDGSEITGYLTLLGSSTAKRPLVVMPHGGPEARDSIDFDPIAQAFAAQGWLVLQPNFRGSDGYGKHFAEAGHRQWSRLMQDDVTDAVNDLVRRELVPPDRIVIYGASYGGYAALAGAVTTPDLYRAAVSRAGVTDLPAFLRFERYRDEESDSQLYDHWVKLIGDPKAESSALRLASPAQRAPEVHIPILLLHGSADRVVPVDQSRLMKSALESAHKDVKLEVFEGEGHSYWSQEDEMKQINDSIAFFKRVLE